MQDMAGRQLVQLLRHILPAFAVPLLLLGAGGLERACVGLDSGATGYVPWCEKLQPHTADRLLQAEAGHCTGYVS